MLEFRIADGCLPTGRLIQKLVGTHAVDAVVCWGVGYSGPLPALNAQASRYNKLQQLQRLIEAGVPVPQTYSELPTNADAYPLLGRRLHHMGGMDIALILQPEDATLRHSDFYTRYIPRQSEYRTWVYRRRILGTYQKVLAYPQRYHRIGANHRNGFVFKLVASEAVPAGLREIAAGAVDSLGLDFGAVDILLGVDGLLYVLECNTAPGVEGEDRQVIRALAAKMRRWIELEFPRRKGETR